MLSLYSIWCLGCMYAFFQYSRIEVNQLFYEGQMDHGLRALWAIQSLSARRSNQSILKEISPEYSLQRLMLKLQSFGHLMQRTDSLGKTLMLGKIEGRRRRGPEDEMVGWYHRLNGHGFEQAPGVDDGQGGLGCCSPWGHKESDTLSDWTTTTVSITATKLYHYSRTIHKQMTWLQWRKVFLNHFRVTGWFEN